MIGEYVLRQDSPMSSDTDGTSCSVMALICVIDNVPCRSIIALPDGPLKFGAAAYRRFIAWGHAVPLHLPSGMVRRSTPTDELTSALEKHRECLNMAHPRPPEWSPTMSAFRQWQRSPQWPILARTGHAPSGCRTSGFTLLRPCARSDF
ncbi:hypothetical protein MES4922_360071 [Mesorhizobium ventifaucium]|uniref:Uncharacterized protein n=1 Tax=Mesorhizobium ventifaucium TaxID=666020 RepID=A0ABM9E5J2_9HYPH|nr:hypothetical protein MES4922_360071 [Mesorhizobium ventifaucium]